jgi:hypothetical protein
MKIRSLDLFDCFGRLYVYSFMSTCLFAQATDIKVMSITTVQVMAETTTNTCIDVKERETLYSSLPYRKGKSSFKLFSTIGQLSKLCDWVIIGSLTNSLQNEEIYKGSKVVGKKEITINVETNLFGGDLDGQVVARLSWLNADYELKPANRMIMFLAKENFDKYRQKQLSFNFSKSNYTGKASDTIFILEGSRGVILLDDRTNEKEMCATILKYLQVLRSPKGKSSFDYFLLLNDLTHSKNERIKMDAISDLILLLQSEENLHLVKILDEPNLLPEIRDFIQCILIPSRSSK